jgi:hypothetical protein
MPFLVLLGFHSTLQYSARHPRAAVHSNDHLIHHPHGAQGDNHIMDTHQRTRNLQMDRRDFFKLSRLEVLKWLA